MVIMCPGPGCVFRGGRMEALLRESLSKEKTVCGCGKLPTTFLQQTGPNRLGT